jgi:hypothetical protein
MCYHAHQQKEKKLKVVVALRNLFLPVDASLWFPHAHATRLHNHIKQTRVLNSVLEYICTFVQANVVFVTKRYFRHKESSARDVQCTVQRVWIARGSIVSF